jgi:hypothetical protein
MRYRTSANVTANAVSGAKATKTTESAGPVITRVDYNFENIAFDAVKTSRSFFKEVMTIGGAGSGLPGIRPLNLDR